MFIALGVNDIVSVPPISYIAHCALIYDVTIDYFTFKPQMFSFLFLFFFSFNLKQLDLIIIMLGYIPYFTELTDQL